MVERKSFITTCLELYQERSFLQAYDSTFELVRADTDALREKAYQLRYEVYCEENGFEKPPSSHKLEYDFYDERAVQYLLLHKSSNEAVGTLRVVLPNDEYPAQSFSIQEHCSHPLMRHDSKILALCEVSRFCTSRRFRKRTKDGRILSAYSDQDNTQGYRRLIPYMPAALLQGAFECALSARILDCVWMVDPCHLTSLERIGFPFQTLGPVVKYHGGAQPIIFNIKNVLDTMRRKNRHCWDVISDLGRLQKVADDLHQNDWQDNLMDEEAWEKLYEQGVEGSDFRDLR